MAATNIPGGGTSNWFGYNGLEIVLAGVSTSVAPYLLDFSDNSGDGTAEVSIKGDAGTRYKLVEAGDLDFSSPDQDPVVLTGATVRTLDGDAVITDGNGDATVQFNLGTTKDATFVRGEESLP